MKNFYIKVLAYFRSNKKKEKILQWVIQISPMIDLISYPFLLVYLFYKHDQRFMICTLVPLTLLILATIIRKVLNAPRPQDVYEIHPIISHSSGESFPSRHAASSFIIGYTFLYISLPLGIITLAIACIVSLSRILGAVHFPKDILGGWLLSSLLALFYLL